MQHHGYKLLLDENIAPRTRFPILNNRHNLKHIAHDCNMAGNSDVEVYTFAVTEKRLILTFNRKDFEPMATKSNNTGIISLSPNLTKEQIDKKITALLSKNTPGKLYGFFHHVT